ncbi:MAG: ABC transporter substrate-binding protein [Candidatus Cloacimonetes bacterium]|nr:ABC transporter substrate-binding protein [Candidatus Cloacimonadota bacterium]
MKSIKNILIIYFIFTFLLTSILFSNETTTKKPIILEVQWFPQAQFAGYIMAFEKGFFEAEGLDVKIKFSDGEDSPIECVLEGEVDFCTAWLSQAITMKSEGKPLVNICQIFQKTTLMLITKKKSGILTPQDMNGKRVGYWGGDFSIQAKAFLRKFKIKADLIPQSFSIDAFLAEAVDVTSAMFYNEYHKIIQSGIDEDEMLPFFFSDYELNFPEDGIYCTENTYNSNPELCKTMREAIISGWEYAFSHQEETLDKIMEYCRDFHLQTNKAHQRWMLWAVITAITYQVGEESSNWGILKKNDFLQVADELKEQNFIKKIPDYENFYKGVSP